LMSGEEGYEALVVGARERNVKDDIFDLVCWSGERRLWIGWLV
jgi:hypothetical protein